MSKSERTFIMIKPDGVQRGLVGEIIKRFEQKGFKLVAMKLVQVGYYYRILSFSNYIFFNSLLRIVLVFEMKYHYLGSRTLLTFVDI